ncbi:MAG: DUF2277 domain-containing protein [Bryobacteraceae bacterium]|nr:DUF2277 domain-containing protein [Bryobacteraceae bacterium]
MCRSIKVLRRAGQPATADELSGAALQFVRKISGFHKPSKKNQEAFERAVEEIRDASDRLLKTLEQPPPVEVSLPGGGPSAALSKLENY